MKAVCISALFILLFQISFTLNTFGTINQPPVFARVENSQGELIESISAEKYAAFPDLYLKSNATDVAWSISPSLPQGLTLYSSYGRIRGSPEEIIDTTVFTIVARNLDGNATTTLTLTVKGCEYGDYLLPQIFGSQLGHLTILHNEQVLYSNPVKSGDMKAVCIAPGTYNYIFNCTSSPSKPYRCSFRLEDEHATHYLSLYSLQAEPVSGTFETIPSKLPVLSIQSVIAAYPEQSIRAYINVLGVYENLTISPALPSSMNLDLSVSAITGKAPSQGLYNFTLTALNKLGSSSFEFYLGVDVCPEPYDLIIFRRNSRTVFDTIQFVDSNGLILFDNDLTFEKKQHNFCLTEDSYRFYFGYTLDKGPGWDEADPLLIYEGDQLMSSFLLESDLLSETRSFSYANIIKKGSGYRYSFEYAEKWRSLKFKDRDWSEASQFNWPSTGSKSLYLRKVVFVASLEKYSFIHLDLITSENVTMYLNEKILLVSPPLANSTRFTYLIQELVTGNNLLAVELKKTSDNKPIQFDMRVQLVTSGCLLQSINGTATENTPDPSPYSPVEKAFDLNPMTFWIARSFPAIARYTFAGSSRHVMNQLMIMNTKNNYPTFLRIQAVDGDSIIDLGSIQSNTFMQKGTYQYIYFENTKAYPAYQVVFEKVAKNFTMNVYDMRFMACNPLTCPKRFRKPSSHLSTVLTKSCPPFQVGTKLVKCRNVDNQAIWVDDLTYCINRYPTKGLSFLDWKVRLYNTTIDAESDLRKALTNLILKNLRVQEEEIGYVYMRDTSTNEMIQVDVDIRFTFDLEIGDYILKHLKQLMQIFKDQIKLYFASVSADISGEVIGKPVLRTPVNILLIVLIVIILILLLLVSLYVFVRMRKNGNSKTRKLHKTHHAKTDETECLIADVYTCLIQTH